MSFPIEKLPMPILAIAACAAVGLVAFQMSTGRDVICGGRIIPATTCDPVAVSDVKGWTSEPFRMGLNESETKHHDLKVIPQIVQVWSSATEKGPWELIDGFAFSSGASYGTWIAEVSAASIRLQSGVISATSTYGNRDHWKRYSGGNSTYVEAAVWFRVTAMADIKTAQANEKKAQASE